MTKRAIPILDLPTIGHEDTHSALIHCESLNTLASLFGRDMQVHRHDRHYQLHYIDSGKVNLHLGDDDYIEEAPLVFITPPPTPHRFVTEPAAQGVVLTVHQSVVQNLFQEACKDEPLIRPNCISFQHLADDLQPYKEQLLTALQGIQLAVQHPEASYYNSTMHQWTKLIFLNVLALIEHTPGVKPSHHSYLSIFRNYLNLIESHYKERPTIPFYAQQLNVTEAKLNTICKTISNSSAKQLTYDRAIQESKYLLSYTRLYIKEVAFEVGFHEPAYFSRFFTNQVGLSPSDYRSQSQKEAAALASAAPTPGSTT